MQLALFDLDHTLIPFDSGMAWLRFLIARGQLPAEAEQTYLTQCQRYVAGEIGVHELHRALVEPLREHARSAFDAQLAAFEAELPSTLPAAARRLVDEHRQAGHCCCVVTATARFVAERYAAAFGIESVLATETGRDAFGLLTGDIVGPPCAGAHKLDKVQGWLQLQGRSLADFERSWFYTDSAGDLPLLQAVSDPVAVRPEPRLRAHAERAGWRIELLAA